MAVEITPLGFKKPDGKELVRGGDNVIADNAQKAQELIQSTQDQIAIQNIRLGSIESAAFVGGGLLMEDPTDPGFYIVGAP